MNADPNVRPGRSHRLYAAPGTRAAGEVETIDARAVNARAERELLYKSREPIHPKKAVGFWRKVKWAALAVLLAIYYLTPWIRWDRGANAPDQAVLVDLARERFYFFWIEIWPQEVYYVTALLILAALALFLVSSLFGRLWCGYACPQTVWTDLFIAVESLWQGDRSARIRLERSPWSFEKAWRKGGTHATWLLIAAATGGAWVFYFHDAPSLARELFVGEAPTSAYLFIGILTFTTYSLAGLMREQVCTYMCPWPRIQGALIDAETLTVTYRADRGEPRGPAKKGTSFDGRGHCIDCKQCVAVCPMGIDIRDGAQLECINCGLCIDACDDVMRRIGLPAGLIAHDDDLNIARRRAGEPTRFRLFRTRTVLYGGLIALVGAITLYGLLTRATIDVNVIRDRNPNFVRLSDGTIRNGYTLKLMNRSPAARALLVEIVGADGLAILPQSDLSGGTVEVEADKVRPVRLFLAASPEARLPAQLDFEFRVTDPATGERHDADAVFVSR